MSESGPRTRWAIAEPRPRRRLRFRTAVGAALGLTVLLAVYAVLMSWAVQVSTEAVRRDRLAMAVSYAAQVDALLGLAEHQLSALASYVAWDEGRRLPQREQPHLARLLHASGTFNALAIAGADGQLIAGVGPPEDQRASVVAPAGAEALRQGRLAVSAAPTTEEHPPIAVLAAPLQSASGEPVAVLLGGLHLAHAGVRLVPLPDEAGDAGTGVHVDIVDGEGRVLASSSGGDTPRRARAPLDLLGPVFRTGQPAAVLREAAGGTGQVVAFAPFQRLPGGAIIEVRHDAALDVPRDLRRIGLFFGSAAVLLVALGAWWYARHITGPLESLTAATRTLAAGEFDRPITYRSGDELGTLAQAFDTMRRQLKEAFEERLRWEAELEGEVRRRTEAVHQLLGKVMSAQEDERRRVARELHDGVAQEMAAMLVALEGLESACRTYNCPIGAKGTALIGRLHAEARETLSELRRLLLDLRPSALDDLGLVAAVRWYVEHRLMPLGIRHSVLVQGDARRLPPAVETALFRIVQEAVHNAARHGAPSAVEVELQFAPANVAVRVSDDGVGFTLPPNQPAGEGEGFGLAGMRERAALLGGRLDVQSRPGQGTRIVATIPLTVEDHAYAPHRR